MKFMIQENMVEHTGFVCIKKYIRKEENNGNIYIIRNNRRYI